MAPNLYNARQAVDLVMLMQLIGREAGNQTDDGMRGVAWSVKNRVARPNFWDWGYDWETVIEKKWAYSSINGAPNDPNLRKYPNLHVEPWERCLAIAEEIFTGTGTDPTAGATHYFDKSLDANPPDWAARMVHTLDLGDFHFYKPA
ncbi:MAG: cell wall hydrolase [Candidatus Acidiferrum sp.]